MYFYWRCKLDIFQLNTYYHTRVDFLNFLKTFIKTNSKSWQFLQWQARSCTLNVFFKIQSWQFIKIKNDQTILNEIKIILAYNASYLKISIISLTYMVKQNIVYSYNSRNVRIIFKNLVICCHRYRCNFIQIFSVLLVIFV